MVSPSPIRRRLLGFLGATITATGMAGCGFHLRGKTPLAFAKIYVGISPNTDLGGGLRRRLRSGGATEVVEHADAADARLEILRDERSREILTLTGAGKVREYELRHAITFRVIDRAGAERIPATTITAKREYNFDDSQILAKEQEEALLYRDMQGDLVEQLIRRLSAIKP